MPGDGDNRADLRDGTNMRLEDKGVRDRAVPPIDADKPRNLETATFALG
jgi:hypothetical protein